MSRSGAALRAAGWVTVGAVAAGGVATAATTSSGGSKPSATTAAVTATQAPVKAGKTRGARVRKTLLRRLEGRLLHGQFVVLGKDKAPTTLAEQRGTVDAVSPTSISLTSTDGFKQTYVVTSETKVRVDGEKSAIADVKTGQSATVIASVSGSTQTAKGIIERAAK
jgi:hypothetical protein